VAKEVNCTRSELIRRAIAHYLIHLKNNH